MSYKIELENIIYYFDSEQQIKDALSLYFNLLSTSAEQSLSFVLENNCSRKEDIRSLTSLVSGVNSSDNTGSIDGSIFTIDASSWETNFGNTLPSNSGNIVNLPKKSVPKKDVPKISRFEIMDLE
jgi:hypothetical protein